MFGPVYILNYYWVLTVHVRTIMDKKKKWKKREVNDLKNLQNLSLSWFEKISREREKINGNEWKITTAWGCVNVLLTRFYCCVLETDTRVSLASLNIAAEYSRLTRAGRSRPTTDATFKVRPFVRCEQSSWLTRQHPTVSVWNRSRMPLGLGVNVLQSSYASPVPGISHSRL